MHIDMYIFSRYHFIASGQKQSKHYSKNEGMVRGVLAISPH